MVLINPEVNDEALTAEIDQITGLVSGTGAEIQSVKRDAPWGRRRLAYPISRFRDATYVVYQFQGAASRVRDIERELKLNERVIRYLVVRLDELPAQEPEAEAQAAAETETAEQVAAEQTLPEDTELAETDETADDAEATEEAV